MRFYQISLHKLLFISLFLICSFSTGAVYGQKAADKKVQRITVDLKVVDDAGNPIPNAQIVIGEGVKHLETDEKGFISVQAFPSDFVTVSSSGFEKSVILVGDILLNKTIKLQKSKLFMTSDDIVPLPFMSVRKRNLTGSSDVIDGDQLDKYPSNDLRNALTGLAPGLEILEKNGATGMSAEEKMGLFGATEKVQMSIRGRSPLVMIDNRPGDITEIQLDPQEVESVTVIRDIVSKAMFGPQAADGIIFINTKRGKENERILNVNIEDGVSIVDRFPQWTTGADYANLNNQARTNSGLLPLYNASDISTFSANDPYNMYNPSVDYRNLMLKNNKPFRRVNLSSQGGNKIVQYFANVGYNGEGDIYKIGPLSDYNRINTRSNLDIRVSDMFKIKFDFFGGLVFRRAPNYGYSANYGQDNSNDATLDYQEFNRVISDITTNSPVTFPVYANNDPSLKAPWYGVSPQFDINPMGRLLQNGYYTESTRTGTVSTAFEYDLSNFISGLKSTTYLGLDASYLIRVGKAKDYIAYNVIPSLTTGGADTILLTKAHDGVDMPGQAKLHDYYYQRITAYENLNYEKSFGNSHLQTSLTYYIYKMTKNGIEEPQREQNIIWTGLYSFKDKYNIQVVLNYAGTYSFNTGKRYQLFPSVGASWVISEENFMSNVKFINFLKLRAETGTIGFEDYLSPFLYRDRWTTNTSGTVFGAYSTSQWFGSTQDNQVYRVTPARIGNPAISWEKRREFNIGLDALALNHKISLELNYYYNVRDGIVTQLNNSLPYFAGISGSNPWYNFNKIAFYGLESGIQFTGKAGEMRFSAGFNSVVQNSKILKYDEPDYRFDYQTRVGKPADSYWGLTSLGKFSSDAEALIISQIYDPVLHEGDLKYEDKNNDGIVDDNDQSSIGHTVPRFIYAINAKVYYKNFEMTLIGSGRALYDIPLTNKYFWNGWGDNNYSNFVRDNVGGSYPKLSYYKVNNNFVNSDFWMTKGGYFKIQNVEFAYRFKMNKNQFIGARAIRLFVRGANLLTFSKVKDVDPESVGSGIDSYPLYRTFTGGINLTF